VMSIQDEYSRIMTVPTVKIRGKLSGRGFSILEQLITLLIAAAVTVIVLQLLQHVSQQTTIISSELNQLSAIEHSFDLLIDDVITAAQANAKIEVTENSIGQLHSSHLSVDGSGWKLDWISAPRYSQEDMVLYRRKIVEGSEEPALYYPLCDNLQAFEVKMVSGQKGAISDPNSQAPFFDVAISFFRSGPDEPGRVRTLRRSCCLKRFQY